MKIIFRLSIEILLALFIISCTSKEETMAITIKNCITKTLQNPESYQPIETQIDTLISDKYGDTLMLDIVLKDIEARKKFYSAHKRYEERQDQIYEAIALSTISDEEKDAIEKGRDILDEYLKEMDSQATILKTLDTEIKASAKYCKGDFYGWLVTHKFNYKSKDGETLTCTYRLYMDKEYKTVFRFLDEDKIPYDSYKTYIDMVLSGQLK